MDRGPEPEPEPEPDRDSHSFDKPKARKNKDQAWKPGSSSDSSGVENVVNDGMDDLAMIMGNMSKPGPRRSGRNVIKPTKYSPPKRGTKQKAHTKKRTIQKAHKAKVRKANPKSVAEITREIKKKQKELDTLKNKLSQKKSSEKKSSKKKSSKKIYGRPATKYDRRDRASHSSTFSKSRSRSRSRSNSKSKSKDKGSFGLEDMFSKFKL